MDESLRDAAIPSEGGSNQKLRHSFERARVALIHYKVEVLCAGILIAVAVNLTSVLGRKSITADEIVLIPAAYYNLVTDDFQLVREHPPLCKLLAGVPLLFIQPQELPSDTISPTMPRGDSEWFYAMRFWEDNRAQFEAICFWARVPLIALTVSFGWLVFAFGRNLFGPRAGLFALILFALEPTLLAHGRVVQTDVVAAFGFLLAAFSLQHYFRKPDWKTAAGVGAAAGVAMLAKFSMVILGPVLLVVFFVMLWRRSRERRAIIWQGVAALEASLLVVNAGYFFRHRPLTGADIEWARNSFPSAATEVLASIRIFRYLLPTDFLIGVYWQLHHSSEGHPAGLLGMYSQRGWWYYFPVAFALKTTIPFLLVALASLAWATYRVVYKHERQFLYLLIPFAVYTLFVMMSPIDIGVRYYLPAYGFLFILGGCLFDSLLRKGGSAKAGLAFALVVLMSLSWMLVESVKAYPNYMSYMNEFASARPHWWYLSDSNVEWGDDVKLLAEYLKARGETRTRALLLGGYVTLGFYGVEYLDANSSSAQPTRYLALGASFLNGSTVPGHDIDGKPATETQRVNTFAEFRNRAPEAIIGDSIYLYRLHE